MATQEQIQENLKKAIDKIVKTEKEVSLLLSGQEMLLVNVKNVFKTLLNNMKHLDTITDIAAGTPAAQEPLTRVLGINVGPKVNKALPKISKDEANAFIEMVDKIYEGFDKRENKDLLESLTRTMILAVAKRAGLTVDEDKEINSQYITHIKQKIKLNREEQAVKDSATKPQVDNQEEVEPGTFDEAAAIAEAVSTFRAGGNVVIKDFGAKHGITDAEVGAIVKKAQAIFAAKPEADEPAETSLVIDWIKNKVDLGDTVTVQGIIDQFGIDEEQAINLLNEANAAIEEQ